MFLKYTSKIVFLFLLLFVAAAPAFADEFHYNSFLIGDRASGMGGAYTAVSDDPTGLYYNPAGIVYATGRNLSASVNAFYNSHKKYENVIAGNGWDRNSSSLLPNFFGITQPLGRFQFGFSYAVPDSIQEDQDQTFTNLPSSTAGVTATKYVINFNNEDTTYNFGPSLACEINSSMSAGITLYLHHRSNQMIMNQFISLDNGTYEWTNQYTELVERGVKPVLGFMWAPAEKITVGLSIAKTFLYSSSITSQSTSFSNTSGTIITREDSPSPDAKRKYPLEVRAGVAYFPTSSLLLALDGKYYTKVDDAVFGNRVSVLNGALGAEYYLSRSWAVRAGIFTDMANTPEIDSSLTGQPEKIDLYGVSASISNFSRNTSITFGGSLTTGSGKAQIISDSTDIQNVKALGWTIFLSSSYSY
jgi:long-chain fatty acid transport protein